MLNDEFKLRDNLNAFIVYITEAHAQDEWNIGESAGTINFVHKTIDDRLKCVDKFIDTFNIEIPVYADNIKNEFENIFASWPTRCYIIEKKRFALISEPVNSEVNILEIFQFLDVMKRSTQTE